MDNIPVSTSSKEEDQSVVITSSSICYTHKFERKTTNMTQKPIRRLKDNPFELKKRKAAFR
jgi:hypothetical protein